MDKFFHILKQSVVASIFVMFAFVATYVPQQWNDVETVHAGAAGGGATEVTQIANNVILAAQQVIQSAIQWATGALANKELILDGIAWAIAKGFVQAMVQDMIAWINSGFKGSPMFVQDVEQFLRDAADVALGDYLNELGGPNSYICSPFRLDIQIAVATQYNLARVNQPTRTCTLTGIIDNMDSFLSGTQGSFSDGGWNDWFDITSSPEIYTPYGAALSAQTGAQARIINTKGEEYSLLNFGGGFISSKICETIESSSGSSEDCIVSTPGKIIQEALSFNIDSDRETLITADEINEIFAAIIGQLGKAVFSSAVDLLDL